MTNEQFVAGAILIDAGVVPNIRRIVSADDFQEPMCRAVFSAALYLDAEGIPVDPVSIRDRARRNGIELPLDYLSELMSVTPTAANAETYAKRTVADATLRKIKTLATQIQEDGTSSPDELLHTLREGVRSISDGNPSQQLLSPAKSLQRFMDFTASAGAGNSNYVPTQFPLLDKLLGGGFIKSGLFIVGARPSVGKSSFAVTLCDQIPGNVLLISLEMSPEMIIAKRISRVTAIPTGKLLSGRLSNEERAKVSEASVWLNNGVFLNSGYGLTVQEIQTLAQGVPDIQAIVIDYLGLVQPSTRGGSTYENVSAISRDLKKLALALNIPVICLSQLSRTVESREDKRPRLSDLRDSGAIEQDADSVMFLYRQDYYDGPTSGKSNVQLCVAKNRHGETGVVNFTFYREYSAFTEVP